jgi:hypothetical protein
VSTFIGSRRYRRGFAMTMYPGVVGGWQRVLIRKVRYSFSGSAPRLSAWLEDRSQIRGECSEGLAWAHSSSGHALLAGMRLAASMRAARAAERLDAVDETDESGSFGSFGHRHSTGHEAAKHLIRQRVLRGVGRLWDQRQSVQRIEAPHAGVRRLG